MAHKADAADLMERVEISGRKPVVARTGAAKATFGKAVSEKHGTPKSEHQPEPIVGLAAPDRFINRELSWLDFNHRVLEEAENPRHPLLERLPLLSISASNLDEFYSVRVAALIGQAKAGATFSSADGRTAAQQLSAIKVRAESLLVDQQRILRDLLGLLRNAGVVLCTTDNLSENEKTWLEAWFMERVFPVVT